MILTLLAAGSILLSRAIDRSPAADLPAVIPTEQLLNPQTDTVTDRAWVAPEQILLDERPLAGPAASPSGGTHPTHSLRIVESAPAPRIPPHTAERPQHPSTADDLLDALYRGRSKAYHDHLASLGPDELDLAVDGLLDVLEDPSLSGRLRGLAAAGLGSIGDPIAIDSLLVAFHSGESAVHTQAAAALARIGGPVAVQSLLDGIAEGSPSQQQAATTALAYAGGNATREALSEAIRESPSVGRRACSKVAGDAQLFSVCLGGS